MSSNAAIFRKLIWITAILLSLVIRIPSLKDKSYSWRPIQTEMTSYWFEKEGIDLLHYQTPIYGPPWQIPFEFPLFQATATIISRFGIGDLEFSSRLTALLYFYLSVTFLYLLCNKIFRDYLTTFVITSLYLWTPYNIYYSTIPLIDYLSVALALAYLFFVLSWLKSLYLARHAFMAMIFGSLGILIKPTTMPIVVIPIVCFIAKDIISIYKDDFSRSFKLRHLINHIWSQRGYWFTLLFIALIPLLSGIIWTRHADQVKSVSLFTHWLISKNLHPHIFGPWQLRFNQEIWIDHIGTALRYLLPYGSIIFVFVRILGILGIIRAPKDDQEINLFIISVIAGIMATLAVFLNLYLHQYYYIALSASMAILGGYGICWVWRVRRNLGPIFKYTLVALIVILSLLNVKDYLKFRKTALKETHRREKGIAWGKNIQQYIPVDKWAIVVEYGWDPVAPYFLERKTMVVSPEENHKPICPLLEDKRFTLVILTDPKFADILERVLNCFKSSVEVMPGVYQVIH